MIHTIKKMFGLVNNDNPEEVQLKHLRKAEYYLEEITSEKKTISQFQGSIMTELHNALKIGEVLSQQGKKRHQDDIANIVILVKEDLDAKSIDQNTIRLLKNIIKDIK